MINSDFYKITRYGDKLGNVNEIGMIIGISATFCFSFFRKRKYGYLMFLLIMIITILLTGSRKSLFLYL